MPVSVDRGRVRYSARLDDATYEQARETGLRPGLLLSGLEAAPQFAASSRH